MDRISDSGSDGCGSIPHGGTKKTLGVCPKSFFVTAPCGIDHLNPVSSCYMLTRMPTTRKML